MSFIDNIEVDLCMLPAFPVPNLLAGSNDEIVHFLFLKI